MLLFLPFSVLVANPKKLLYTVANPARGLLIGKKPTTVVVVVVVVVVFTLKTVLTSIQYPSLSYSSRQRNEFPWSHANPK